MKCEQESEHISLKMTGVRHQRLQLEVKSLSQNGQPQPILPLISV